LKDPLASFTLLQGHMTMHFTMFVASLFVNSDNGYQTGMDQKL
jgi:hypothetical protein